MPHVFLSYSKKDFHFAELARIKLAEENISVWIDQGQLRAGDDWRNGIDQGLTECFAVLLVVSGDSVASSYVTYEWASAMGKGKPIIPIRLDMCAIHPKLEAIQYLDFSSATHQPWSILIERIGEIEQDNELPEYDQTLQAGVGGLGHSSDEVDPVVDSILKYLNERGYQMMSFNRIRKRKIVDAEFSDEDFERLIQRHRMILRLAKLKDGKRGVAKL